MNTLDEREARLATWAAALAALAFVGLYAQGFDELRYVVLAAIGAAAAGLLALAARSRRRFLTGLAALLVGFGPWAFAWVLGAPYLLLSGWLLFRARPRPRDDARDADGAAGDGLATEGVRLETPPADTRPALRSSRRRSRPEPAAPARPRRPGPNKRYTPPARRR